MACLSLGVMEDREWSKIRDVQEQERQDFGFRPRKELGTWLL